MESESHGLETVILTWMKAYDENSQEIPFFQLNWVTRIIYCTWSDVAIWRTSVLPGLILLVHTEYLIWNTYGSTANYWIKSGISCNDWPELRWSQCNSSSSFSLFTVKQQIETEYCWLFPNVTSTFRSEYTRGTRNRLTQAGKVKNLTVAYTLNTV